jgi:hypothetical protein
MGKTKDLGHLAHIVAYDSGNNITVPAAITMNTNQLVASQAYVDAALASYALISSLSGYVPTSRTITINGTTLDLSANRSFTIAAGLTSFNTRTGAITLTSGDVTTALGYTPYNSTNPAGYITGYTETDTLATVTGRGATTNSAVIINNTLAVNTASPYLTSTYSLDINGALLVKNTGRAANITLINADPAGGGNNAFVVHTVSGTSGSSLVDIQGYYGSSIAGSTTIRLNPLGGNVTINGYTVYHTNNLPSIPTNTNQLTNGAGYITSSGSISGSAGSVAWTNVTGRPTALSSFSNDSGYLTSVSISNITDAHRFWNNMGNNHGTYQDFNSVGNFGVRYLQGSANGPQSGQHYGFTLGLGNEYSYGTYASQFYWLRNTTNPYIWIRYQEGGSWNAWTKTSAGYADNAGNTNSVSNATGGTYTWTGAQNNFLGNGNTGGTNNVGMIVYSTGGNGAQFSFHRSGAYATNMGLDSDNIIRIGGWSAPANRFQMDMSGNLTMSGDVTAYSDARVKENVETIKNALNKVLALRGVSYNRTDSDDKKTKIGVIAQETLPILPEVVNQDNDGMYNVSYGNMGGLFIEAFKEQQTQIEELKSIIDGLTK